MFLAPGTMMESWAWAYVDYCMRPLDKILVASNDFYECLIRHTDKKVEQLPLGVNLHLFHPASPATASDHRQQVILYVGRLSQEKDLEVLFDAFRILNHQEHYQLRIVGDGPLRNKPSASFVAYHMHRISA